ncbi:MAG TPA: thymidine kinase [Acidimicrobiia bacterium]|nr:thymidine kinase [Acidimicrobiia bacterium]
MMWRRGDHGWLEVICGPMFSGKSEELIRRVTRAAIARIPVQVFKPALDNRYADEKVVSHSSLSVAAQPVDSARELLMAVHDHTEVIGVDEGQFFDDELVEVVERLAASAKQVIVAGLDLDYLRRPFEPIPTLCGRAEYVTKALAVCHRCGGPALYTQRILRSDDLVVLGATGAYEARCRGCYSPDEGQQPELAIEP